MIDISRDFPELSIAPKNEIVNHLEVCLALCIYRHCSRVWEGKTMTFTRYDHEVAYRFIYQDDGTVVGELRLNDKWMPYRRTEIIKLVVSLINKQPVYISGDWIVYREFEDAYKSLANEKFGQSFETRPVIVDDDDYDYE